MGREYESKLAELEEELTNQDREMKVEQSEQEEEEDQLESVHQLSVVHESLKESVFSFNQHEEHNNPRESVVLKSE